MNQLFFVDCKGMFNKKVLMFLIAISRFNDVRQRTVGNLKKTTIKNGPKLLPHLVTCLWQKRLEKFLYSGIYGSKE